MALRVVDALFVRTAQQIRAHDHALHTLLLQKVQDCCADHLILACVKHGREPFAQRNDVTPVLPHNADDNLARPRDIGTIPCNRGNRVAAESASGLSRDPLLR